MALISNTSHLDFNFARGGPMVLSVQKNAESAQDHDDLYKATLYLKSVAADKFFGSHADGAATCHIFSSNL